MRPLIRAVLVVAALVAVVAGPVRAPAATAAYTPPPAGAAWVPFIGTEYVACTMGNPDPWGVCSNHHSYTGAVDFNMPTGRSIHAAGPGVVTVGETSCVGQGGSGYCALDGNWVAVEHPNGKVSRYVHLETVSVTNGQPVSAGQKIGTSGITGNAVVPHLHYAEEQPLFTRSTIGDMFACHGNSVVRYPDSLGYHAWEDVPFGTEIRNDGYGCIGSTFLDVPDTSPFVSEIIWMANTGLTTGYTDGSFHPLDEVKRQHTAAWFHRLDGSPGGPFPEPGFVDVSAGHGFYDEIAWAKHDGLSTGYPDNTFRPLDCVSRAAFVAFLYREAGSPAVADPTPGFTDVGADHPFATEIAWAAQTGVSSGYLDGSWRPELCLSRQAAAAFLYRQYA